VTSAHGQRMTERTRDPMDAQVSTKNSTQYATYAEPDAPGPDERSRHSRLRIERRAREQAGRKDADDDHRACCQEERDSGTAVHFAPTIRSRDGETSLLCGEWAAVDLSKVSIRR